MQIIGKHEHGGPRGMRLAPTISKAYAIQTNYLFCLAFKPYSSLQFAAPKHATEQAGRINMFIIITSPAICRKPGKWQMGTAMQKSSANQEQDL